MRRQEEVKLFLFADDMILYLKDPKTLPKLLETINSFIKVAGHKINIQKSVSFLDIKNEALGKKSRIQSHVQYLQKQ
jgi:hypothetical protein